MQITFPALPVLALTQVAHCLKFDYSQKLKEIDACDIQAYNFLAEQGYVDEYGAPDVGQNAQTSGWFYGGSAPEPEAPISKEKRPVQGKRPGQAVANDQADAKNNDFALRDYIGGAMADRLGSWGAFQDVAAKQAEVTGITADDVLNKEPLFMKKTKAMVAKLKEAAEGAETIPLTIFSAALRRMKNNIKHEEGKWEYVSHEELMRSYAMSQEQKKIDQIQEHPKSTDEERQKWEPFLVSEFDNEKQLMIMQLYDYHNIQELVVGMKDVQARKNDAIGNGLLAIGDFAWEHGDVDVRDPIAVIKLAYAAGSELTQAAADARVKELQDESNDLCMRMIDQMIGSMEDIEKFVGQTPAHYGALKEKLEYYKHGLEFEGISHYSCVKWQEEEFAELFYGEITDALLESVEKGKLDMYKGKVYEPVEDIKLIMSNLVSEYLATAYDIKGAKKH